MIYIFQEKKDQHLNKNQLMKLKFKQLKELN